MLQVHFGVAGCEDVSLVQEVKVDVMEDAISVRGQDDGYNFSSSDVVQGFSNMIELGQVRCDGWGAGFELGLHHTSGLVVLKGGQWQIQKIAKKGAQSLGREGG